MNKKSIPFVVTCFLLLLATRIYGAEFQYHYVGNPFTDVRGVYTTDMFIEIWMTVELPSSTNFAGHVGSYITDFTATDGVQEISVDTLNVARSLLITGDHGQIIDWEFQFVSTESAEGAISTRNCTWWASPPLRCLDHWATDVATSVGVIPDAGQNFDSPGSWSLVAPGNHPPVADAGPDQAVRPGDLVTLDGSASFDDNTATAALLYEWSLTSVPEESSAMLSGKTTQTPSFVVDVQGTYVVQLVVTDEDGLASSPAEVHISSDNLAPTADAGSNLVAILGQPITLDGSGSSDPESDPISFSWALTSKPVGSIATIAGGDTAMPTFTPDVEGLYVVELVVSDIIGPSAPDSVEITAIDADTFAEIKIQGASEVVLGLDSGSHFTSKGHQRVVNNFLIHAIAAIQSEDLVETQREIEKVIQRTDGCVLRGTPDENGSELRDWITDCLWQEEVYRLLSEALGAIGL